MIVTPFAPALLPVSLVLKAKKEAERKKAEAEGKEVPEEEEEEKDVEMDEEEEEEEEEAEEVDEEPPKAELTPEEKKMKFRKTALPDVASSLLNRCFTKFTVPDLEEGFDDIAYEWSQGGKAVDYVSKWIKEKKLTSRVEDLTPLHLVQDESGCLAEGPLALAGQGTGVQVQAGEEGSGQAGEGEQEEDGRSEGGCREGKERGREGRGQGRGERRGREGGGGESRSNGSR